MPQTRSGRSTENSPGSSVPSPRLSSLEAALPPLPLSAPQYTSLQTSCTTSQQSSQVDPSTPLSSPLTLDMDIDPDSSVKSLIGTLVHHLQQFTQTLQEPRTIVWYNELRGANAPIFIGAPDPVAAENWIKVMEKLYRAMEVPHDKWVKLAVPFLLGKAEMWYETIEALYGQIHDWATFKDHFYKNYFPMPVRNQKIKEFVNLKQGSMTVLEYAHKFFELGKFVPDVMEDELMKIGKFEEGFNFVIKSGLSGQRANDFSDLLEKAIRAENIGNIFSQTTAVVKKTIESDPIGTVTASAPVNKKPGVTTLTSPQCQKCNKHHSGECWNPFCYQFGQMGHVRNECKLGQTQTSVPTVANFKEFVNLKQGSMTVTENAKKFLEPRTLVPAVTTLTPPHCQKCNKHHSGECYVWSRLCRLCGEFGHVGNSCPKRCQTQTSAQTPSPASAQTPSPGSAQTPSQTSAQTPSQTSVQVKVCFQCREMGHLRNSCPNRDPNAQTTSQDAPRRGKRKCPGRDVLWTAGSEEVDETKPTDNGAELSSNPETAIHPPETAIHNMSNILSQATEGVKKTIKSDNKKPAVTTLITPQQCRRCGGFGHGRKKCPKRGQTQTIAQTPSPASAQTPSQTSMQVQACFLCGQMGHVHDRCPNRDPNGQTTSQDAPRRGKRKCPGRDVTWTAGSEEVDETKPTDNGAELSLYPEAAIHPPEAAIHPPDASIHPPEAAILHPPGEAVIHPPEAAVIHPPEATILHPPEAAVIHPPEVAINLESLLEDVKSSSS